MIFERVVWGNTLLTWILAVSITIGGAFVLQIIKLVLVKHLGALAKKTAISIDDLVVDLLARTNILFLLYCSLMVASLFLDIPAAATRYKHVVFGLVFLFQGALWGSGVITFVINKKIKKRIGSDSAGATTLAVLGFVSKIVLWTVILLMALENLGVNISALVAGLGIGGVAVALAVQNVLGDLLASLSIALDKPFAIGDFITVDDYLGTIEHIGVKTTRVRSLSGEELVFSNTDLLKSRIRNFKRMYERRVVFSFCVTYQTAIDTLAAIPGRVREIIEKQNQTRFDRAHFKEFSDSGLVFEVVYYVANPDYNIYMDLQQTINLELMRYFVEKGIELAYPARTIYAISQLDSSQAARHPLGS